MSCKIDYFYTLLLITQTLWDLKISSTCREFEF